MIGAGVLLLICGFGSSVQTQTDVQLIVQKAGEGGGIVVSSPPGIECGDGGSNSSGTFESGTPVTLTPRETTSSSAFEGWSVTSGSTTHCEATNGPCSFLISADSTVTATFMLSNPQ